MKKIFYTLILFIAFLFTTTAQTTIVNRLEIKSVTTDTTATDVLVRGVDRKVKKVPVSFLKTTLPEFKTVGGQSLFGIGDIAFPTYTTPNIQQVINISPNLDGYGASVFGKSLNFDNEFSGFKRKIRFGNNQIDIYSYETNLYYPIARLNLTDNHIQHTSVDGNISKSYKLNTSGILLIKLIDGSENITQNILFPDANATQPSRTLPISVNGNYADETGNITVNSLASSGNYTPTFEIISNLSNVTGGATPSYYTKVGNVVTVYIRFFNNQSAANTATAFRASLPFTRATTNQINYVGTGSVGYGGTESDIPCRVFFESGQTSCRISYYTKANFGTQPGVVSFQYSVDE